MKYFILTLLIFTSFLCFSQDEDDYKKEMPTIDENTSKYFEDGIHSGSKGFLSLSIGEYLSGSIMLNYEGKISLQNSFVIGLGYPILTGGDVNPFNLSSPIQDRYYDRSDYVNRGYTGIKNSNVGTYTADARSLDISPSGGIVYLLGVKNYPHRTAITSSNYSSLFLRHRIFNYNTFNYSRFDVFYKYGCNKIFRNNIGTDLSFGVGGRRSDLKIKKSHGLYDNLSAPDEPDKYKTEYLFIWLLQLNVGYFF